jgi:hypothetical protein
MQHAQRVLKQRAVSQTVFLRCARCARVACGSASCPRYQPLPVMTAVCAGHALRLRAGVHLVNLLTRQHLAICPFETSAPVSPRRRPRGLRTAAHGEPPHGVGGERDAELERGCARQGGGRGRADTHGLAGLSRRLLRHAAGGGRRHAAQRRGGRRVEPGRLAGARGAAPGEPRASRGPLHGVWTGGRADAPRGTQLGEGEEFDEFDLEPEALSYFQFAAHGGGFGASGLPAACAAATPGPGGGAFSPPPPPAPRKGPTAFPTRVQARARACPAQRRCSRLARLSLSCARPARCSRCPAPLTRPSRVLPCRAAPPAQAAAASASPAPRARRAPGTLAHPCPCSRSLLTPALAAHPHSCCSPAGCGAGAHRSAGARPTTMVARAAVRRLVTAPAPPPATARRRTPPPARPRPGRRTRCVIALLRCSGRAAAPHGVRTAVQKCALTARALPRAGRRAQQPVLPGAHAGHHGHAQAPG